MRVSLRARVAAWIAVAVLFSGALVLAVVREGVRQALLHELDTSLQAEADEIALERAQLAHEPARLYEIMELQARAHRDGAWYSQLLDLNGQVLYATTTTPPKPPQLPRSGSGAPDTVGRYRIVERISEGEGQSPALVRVGTSMPVVNSDLVRIDHLVGIAAISVLLAAPLTGFVLATIALRPITEMTERTHRMHPQRMEERLPLRGTNDELDRLAKVINNLLSRIAQYVRHHRGSMADAAHQLRTPLAAIRSSVEVILAADENTPENRDLLYRAVEQIESLESLVNQLLLLAETEVDTLRPAEEAVPLDTLVRSSLEMFDAVAESLGVQLEVAELQPVVVQGNRHHLRQVVNNLLDNAIKFTAIKRDEPRTVSLRLVGDAQHETAVLEVADTGIGIPSEQLDQVFDRFYRGGSLEQSEANVRGNGLGLSIVKSVVQSHGGTATVTSSLGTGTRFTIALPRLNVPASASA